MPEANRFAAEEIALAASISPGTADWHLRRAAFIRHRLPAAWQAWRAGTLTQAKVFACYDEVADCTDAVIDEFARTSFDPDIRARDGLTAAERAADDSAGQFHDRAHRLVARLDADAARRRRDRRVRGRRVLGRHDRDGVRYLSGTDLPLESVAAAYEYVDAIARVEERRGPALAGRVAPTSTPTCSPAAPATTATTCSATPTTTRRRPTERCPTSRCRTHQRRSSGRAGARAAGAHARALRPAGRRRYPAEIDDYGPLPADIARRLIRHAGRRRSHRALTLVTRLPAARASRSASTGVRPERRPGPERAPHDPTRPQRRFVQARDRQCCFPGCRRRAITCDIDHTRPWEEGGPTCECSLRPLCRRHHQTKQDPGWTLVLDPVTDTSRWISPHGLRASNDTHRLDPQLYQMSGDFHRQRRPRTRPTIDPDAT